MTMAAATMILAGCGNDEPVDNWNGEIRLTSGVTVQTRANSSDVPDKQIAEGEKVYIWVDEAIQTTTMPGITTYIVAWTLTANGQGAFNGNAKYYPSDGGNLDFYAMHGNFTYTEGSDAFPKEAITHAVAADQSSNLGANYLKSDLLYGLQKGVARSKKAVNLPFYHLLSKVEVALKSGNGYPNLTYGATVTIENTRLKAAFTPSKSAEINHADATTAQAARAGLVTCPENNNDVSPITIATKVTSNDFSTGTEYAAAILVPQTVAKGTKFIKVVLIDGGTFYYAIPDADITFESGKKYQYQITVNKTGLSVTSTVSDWTPITAITGEAVMD